MKYPEYEIHSCAHKNLCVDCDYKKCINCGEARADCPKYKCDNDKPLDCENCVFLKGYVADMRRKYAKNNE